MISQPLTFLVLPFVISASLYLATRRWIPAFLCGAAILPVMLLVSVVVWPPGPREWQVLLGYAIVLGSYTAGFGTAVSWAFLKTVGWTLRKVKELRSKPF
jgi:hypothetical protein